MSPTTDSELVRRVLVLHQQEAYCDLVRKYQVNLRSYLFRLTHSREFADDLAQETFLNGYRHLDQLKDQNKFRAWIFGIAHAQFLQWHRGHKTFANSEDLEIAQDTDFFAGTEIHLLFKNLRPEEQSALTLCLAHDFTHQEAATMLQLPLGTVKSLITRAREKIGVSI